MSEEWGAFWIGVFLGCLLIGVLATRVPGIGYNDALKSKQACEKSLPRDQVCVPNYLPQSKQVTP